jgi:hypothetical protein
MPALAARRRNLPEATAIAQGISALMIGRMPGPRPHRNMKSHRIARRHVFGGSAAPRSGSDAIAAPI